MKLPPQSDYLIGVVSDTHGLVRPEALRALAGVDLIIHAGDVGAPQVLTALEQVAPVAAVRGNVDVGAWAQQLPENEVVEAGPILLYVLHDLGGLDLDPQAAGFQAIISGHSHQPAISRRHDLLYLNPGSIGPRRFRLPVSLALLQVQNSSLLPRIITL